VLAANLGAPRAAEPSRASTGEDVSMTFHSLYAHGFARVAACTADVFIADPVRNAESIVDVSRRCSEQGVAVAVFPELSLTGYAIDDLLGQDALLDAVRWITRFTSQQHPSRMRKRKWHGSDGPEWSGKNGGQDAARRHDGLPGGRSRSAETGTADATVKRVRSTHGVPRGPYRPVAEKCW